MNRIVSWNCNGGFKKKFESLIQIPADLYLIQEVESNIDWLNIPNFPATNFIFNVKSAGNYCDKRGVLAFSFSNSKIHSLHRFEDLEMRYYQYFKFKKQRILNVWTHGNYIEDLFSLVLLNRAELFKDDNGLIIGDFNSNAIWNRKHIFRNHSDFNQLLAKYQYYSAYHLLNHVIFGEEQQFTFRMWRKEELGYHIDYAYGPLTCMRSFEIDHCLDQLSDHSVLRLVID